MDKPFEPIFTHDNLFEHKMIIHKWINSCEKFEQLKLLIAFIDQTFLPGYEKAVEDAKEKADKEVFKFDLQVYKTELTESIDFRKMIVAKQSD